LTKKKGAAVKLLVTGCAPDEEKGLERAVNEIDFFIRRASFQSCCRERWQRKEE
jgi:hypothetical protein